MSVNAINVDRLKNPHTLIESTTPHSRDNATLSTNTSASLYTSYSSHKKLPFHTYARKDDVPHSNSHLFTLDYVYPNSDKVSKRYFRSDFIELFLFLEDIPPEQRIFYEYIEGPLRKPYFDIEYEYDDVDKSTAVSNFNQIIDRVLFGIRTEFESKSVPYSQERDCIILSSHGPNKLSVHIIINNFFFNKCDRKNTSNVFHFAQAVRKHVPQNLWTFHHNDSNHSTIDPSVYSSGREFRLIWNTKLNKNRFLDVDGSTGINARFPRLPGDPTNMDERLSKLRLFEACLITAVSNCKLLPDWAPVNDNKHTNPSKTLNNSQFNHMIDVFEQSQYSDIWRIDDNRYSTSSCYLLPRHKPFLCPIHHRNHDSNNAIMSIGYDSNIYIRCFAEGPNSTVCIGKDIQVDNDDEEYSDDELLTETLGGFNLITGKFEPRDIIIDPVLEQVTITQSVTNQRVPAHAIINNNNNNTNTNTNTNTNNNNNNNNDKFHTYPINVGHSDTSHCSGYLQIDPIVTDQINNNEQYNNIGKTTNMIMGGKAFCQSRLPLENKFGSVNINSVFDSNNLLVNNVRNKYHVENSKNASPPEMLKKINKTQTLNKVTLETFLNNNKVYLPGYSYPVKDLYDSYEQYRGVNSVQYNYSNGEFGKTLAKLGHLTEQRRFNGNKIRMVILTPKVKMVGNPIERTRELQNYRQQNQAIEATINHDPTKTFTSEEITAVIQKTKEDNKPDEQVTNAVQTNISNHVTNAVRANISTQGNTMIERQCVELNPYIHVRAFMDEYLEEDANESVDIDNLYLCFVNYCDDNKIIVGKFKRGRLMNFFKKWLVQDIDGIVMKGWKCKSDQELMTNEDKEYAYNRIWYLNTDPYMIGWHNGTYDERYDKKGEKSDEMTKRKWEKIDIKRHNDKNIRTIDEMIEMTADYENTLPERVKRVKEDILRVFQIPEYRMKAREYDNTRMTMMTALIDEVIENNSEEHMILERRLSELYAEMTRISEDERNRLKESIREDEERTRREASWCIGVRSTFGSGKTVNLRPYIERQPEMRVLIVLPRISLSDDYMVEYRRLGFEIYTEMNQKGDIRGNRVIVCFPSIDRVKGRFDLLVIDELKVAKDLQHTLVRKNGRKGNKKTKERSCYETMCQYVAETKRVYIADALLTNAQVLEMSRMRERTRSYDERVTIYQNMNMKHQGKKVYTVNDKSLMINMITKWVREGKRVVVPTNSKSYAEYLNKHIIESGIEANISLSTGERRATESVQTMWQGKNLIIYTPTILAGNSYTEEIDVVCGFFTTTSCDQADAMQMLFRARNNRSNEYYICVEKGVGGRLVPDSVYHSFDGIKRYLIENSRGVREKNTMMGWAEEYTLPVEMIEYDHINDQLKEDDMYFNSYVNYIKQCVTKERDYLFRMLLYMRDCGFEYGGNIYTKTEDKMDIKMIKEERKEYNKEKREKELEEQEKCVSIGDVEYRYLETLMNKTNDDKRRMKKYRMMRCYKVENTPQWFLKETKGRYQQYANINRFKRMNGVIDQKERYQMMGEIGKNYMEKEEQDGNDYDVVEDIRDTDKAWTNNMCYHAMNILKLIGAEEFIRETNVFEVNSREFNKDHVEKYMEDNKVNMWRMLLKKVEEDMMKMASEITDRAFGIKIRVTEEGYTVINRWIKVNDGDEYYIWPYNKEGGEELIPLKNRRQINTMNWINKKCFEIKINKEPTIKHLQLVVQKL